MIELRALKKSFEDSILLDDVNYQIRQGEGHLWKGHNGCGKTTLSRILCGLEAFDSGELLKPSEISLMLVQQDFVIWPQLTVKKNLTLAAPPSQWSSIAKELSLTELLQKKAGILSYGQKQRLCLARALATNPDLLILDEAVSHLDQKQLETVRESIKKRLSKGMACIWITHRPEEVLPLQPKIWQFQEQSLREK